MNSLKIDIVTIDRVAMNSLASDSVIVDWVNRDSEADLVIELVIYLVLELRIVIHARGRRGLL